MKELIVVKNVKKEYKLGDTIVKALRGVDLIVHKKDFIVILGPSGSGKSTLLHLISALDKPTHGKVLIDGKDIEFMTEFELARLRREKMGFIFQTFNLIPTLNALDNVTIPTVPTPVTPAEAKHRGKELLQLVGLEHRLKHKPKELSGGERQRVSIARALINDPEIIFADEPTGNLDSITGRQIVEIMKKLNEEKDKTFVIVTHDPSLVEYANKVFFLRDGQIVKDHHKEINMLRAAAKGK